MTQLVPPAAYLGKVFPQGSFPGGVEQVVQERVFKPRRKSKLVSVEFPLDWDQKGNADRNFRMQLQGWTMLHPVISEFDELEDKGAAVEYFLDVLRDWWRKFADSPEDVVTARTPSDYTWYDMSVGFRSLVLAFFASRIDAYDLQIETQDLVTLRSAIDKHRRHLRQEKVIYPNNHGIFQIHGLRALAAVSDDGESANDREYAVTWMEKLLAAQFDEAGIHREHSPHYHKFVLETFVAVESSGWYDGSHEFKARLDKARGILPWLLDGQRRPPAVGDSLSTPLPDVVLPEPMDGGPIFGSNFAKSGYAVVRTNWGVPPQDETFLFVTGGYHSKSHKHRDCLSFEWSECGEKLISDSGKYGYWADATRRYMLSSRAHNSLEIEDFDILKMSPYGSVLKNPVEISDGVWRVDGELDFAAVRHRRSFFLSPGRWLIIQDHQASARERDVTQWFHLGIGFDKAPKKKDSRLHFARADGQSLVVSQLAPGLEVRLVRGEGAGTDRMQGFLSFRDDELSEGFALGFKSNKVKGFYGLAVLALDEKLAIEAESFARSLHIDREFAVSSKPTQRPLQRVSLDGLRHPEGTFLPSQGHDDNATPKPKSGRVRRLLGRVQRDRQA